MTTRAEIQAAIAVLTAQAAALPPEPQPTTAAPSAFMTASEYAAHLRVSPRTLRRLISEGLPIVRPRPRLVRIPVSAAADWMARRSRSATIAAVRGSVQ